MFTNCVAKLLDHEYYSANYHTILPPREEHMSYLKRCAPLFVLMVLIGTLAAAQQATIVHSSNLRKSPSTQSKILGSLEAGDVVE